MSSPQDGMMFPLILIVIAIRPHVALDFSNIDGYGNNLEDPARGSAGTFYSAPKKRSFEDGISAMPRGRPSPRLISDRLGREFHGTSAESEHSVAMLAWGQAIAHDVGDMHDNSSDSAPIPVPLCDYAFDASCRGNQTLPFARGRYFQNGTEPRRFYNYASAYIDASWLYGPDMIREFSGGRLHMPENVFPDWGPLSAPQNYSQCRRPRVADGRAMENVGLLNIYLLFGREHNRISAEISAQEPTWNDERIFNESRMRTIALVQKITIEEYSTILLGRSAKGFGTYDANVDPSIDLLFSTAAYRYGHSAIPGIYNVGDQYIPLRDAQFNSCVTMLDSDMVIRGMPTTPINGVDTQFTTDLRDHLKTAPSMLMGAHDLFSQNIQRGRDVGLPSYNDARQLMNLPRVETFEELASGDGAKATILKELYGDVDNVDFYVGGLLEQKQIHTVGSGSSELGPTFANVIWEQFQRLRRGDRFWYEWHPELVAFVAGRGLQQVIQDNTFGGEIAPSPFLFVNDENPADHTASGTFLGGISPTKVGSTSKSALLQKIGLEMSWELTDSSSLRLTIAGLVGQKQWVSVGFGPSSKSMKDTDYIVVKLSSSGCTIGDFWSSDHAVSPVEDPGAASFSEVSCEISDGQLTASLTRPLTASDGMDVTIDVNSQAFIYAAANSPWPAYHRTLRGGGTVDLTSGSLSLASSDEDDKIRKVWIVHGLIMVSLFSLGYPIAILSVMFFRHTRWGFRIHKMVGQFGIGAIIATVLTMLVSSGNWTTHGVMGFLTVCAAMTLAIFGNILEYINPKFRHPIKILHRSLGYIVISTTPITSWLGFQLLLPFESEALSSTPCLWYLPSLSVVAFAIGERIYRRYRKELTLDVFQERVKSGEMLMLVHNHVIDINTWESQHPGGAAVLAPFVGRDATSVFSGEVNFMEDSGFKKSYKHSTGAKKMLTSIHVGLLVGENTGPTKSSVDKSNLIGSTGRDDGGDDMYEMRLVSVQDETRYGEVKRFTFTTSSPLFQGHAVTFIKKQTGLERDYSVVDVGIVQGKLHLTFIIKIYPEGEMTQWLNKLTEGDVVWVREKQTDRILSKASHGCWQQLIMLAGGTGINPMLRILDHHIENQHDAPEMSLVLVWWLQSCDDAFIKLSQLQDFINKLKGMLKIRICLTRETESTLHNTEFGKWLEKSGGGKKVDNSKGANTSQNTKAQKKKGKKDGVADEQSQSHQGVVKLALDHSSLIVQAGRDVTRALDWVKAAVDQNELSMGNSTNHEEKSRGLICGPSSFCTDVGKKFKMSMLYMSDHTIVL